MEDLKKIEQKVQDIYLSFKMLDIDIVENISLIDGLSGILLFVYEYEKIYTNNSFSLSIRILNRILELINKKRTDYRFSSGILGVNLVLKTIIFEEILDSETQSVLKSFTQKIDKSCFNYLKNSEFLGFSDFLHGELGGIWSIGLYSNYKQKKVFQKYLKNFIKVSGIEEKGFFYTLPKVVVGNNTVSLGLSHGVPSALSIFAQNLKPGRWEEKVIRKMKNFINSTKNDTGCCIFPSLIVDQNKVEYSRMGWCYGDLSVALSFWYAGKKTLNKDWQQEAIDIFLASIKRNDIEKEMIKDAGLCHGTAGIAHIYNRMYWETNILDFKKIANFWVDKTLEMSYHKNSLAGFSAFYENHFEDDYSFLEGISGIGLALLFHINPKVEPTWDKCLLIS